jgi:hypothetical protein
MLISLDSFGGQIPRIGREQLPKNAAQTAKNCLLLSGELRGLHRHREVKDLTAVGGDIGMAFRVHQPPLPDYWKTFVDRNSFFIKGLIVNDAWDRYYWTSEDESFPMYNTLARLNSSDPAYKLGVPRPDNTPTLVADDTGVGDIYSRAYGFTFVTEYGEEGPLSELIVASGRPDDGWTIGNMDVVMPDAGPYATITKNIYRSVSGTLGTALFLVVEDIPLAQATYVDSESDEVIALNRQSESVNWYPPPVDLEGILTHPNGFVVGFSGRDLYFSEPYRPHAYPPEYVVSTEHKIIGLGIYGTSIAVMTEGFPAVANGTHPATMSLSNSQFSEPCLSKFSIVSMPFGVYYAGANGLMLVNQAGINNATERILTKDEWELQYSPSTIEAARWQDYYIGFYSADDGFMFMPTEQQASFTEMDRYWRQDAIFTDAETSEVLSLFEKRVFEWNPPDGIPLTYIWKSKEFRTPRPVNFGAYRIYWDKNILTPAATGDIITYNTNRINAGALNVFNMHSFNSGDIYDIDPTYIENRMPFGGSPLIDTTAGTLTNNLLLRVFADGVLKYTNSVLNEKMMRLPSGYKADRWAFELEGSVDVRNVVIAETSKELANA